ncbi:MAG TPA: methyltransferase [Thermoanaerobaculia bacterium]|jgi:2-polyprenyl-3-methyl-5-hydroxy-6-metoxy-1,4-benzoquinol methylase|nr:methyltransferase [Thermoanaerobaculia bacterium]
MKLGGIPQNPIERIGKALGLLPEPLLDTHIAMLLARTIMEGSRLGVYEALKDGPLTAGEIAARCGGEERALAKLLNALAGCEYLSFQEGRYALAPKTRKWLLPDALHDKMLFQILEWDYIETLGEFVRTGKPLDIHAAMTPEQWGLYQRGMRSATSSWAPEVGKRTPVPKGARDMLDIGGSHGLLSVAICRRHPGLRSVILDLPEAVEHAAPILAQEGMGDRVTHRAGNVLTDDLGTEAWDVIFVASLVHHFDDATNRRLAKKIAKALRPGGVFVIQELYRTNTPNEAGQIGALLDLYFALTSQSGTWSFEEMAGWQREAGLKPMKPVKFLTAPGNGQQAAVKAK